MTTETSITVTEPTAPVVHKSAIGGEASPFALATFQAVWEFAKIAVNSGYTACKTPEQAVFTIAVGEELGMSATQSLRGIYCVEGKPTLAADTMLALVLKSGKCRVFTLVESTEKICRIVTGRVGMEGNSEFSWSEADAQRAGLAGRQTWKSYAKTMLRHRCTAEALRAVFPDVLLGVYTPEEMEPVFAVSERVEHAMAESFPPGTPVVEGIAARLATPAPAADPPKPRGRPRAAAPAPTHAEVVAVLQKEVDRQNAATEPEIVDAELVEPGPPMSDTRPYEQAPASAPIAEAPKAAPPPAPHRGALPIAQGPLPPPAPAGSPPLTAESDPVAVMATCKSLSELSATSTNLIRAGIDRNIVSRAFLARSQALRSK